jgi:hypothetical protein
MRQHQMVGPISRRDKADGMTLKVDFGLVRILIGYNCPCGLPLLSELD